MNYLKKKLNIIPTKINLNIPDNEDTKRQWLIATGQTLKRFGKYHQAVWYHLKW